MTNTSFTYPMRLAHRCGKKINFRTLEQKIPQRLWHHGTGRNIKSPPRRTSPLMGSPKFLSLPILRARVRDVRFPNAQQLLHSLDYTAAPAVAGSRRSEHQHPGFVGQLCSSMYDMKLQLLSPTTHLERGRSMHSSTAKFNQEVGDHVTLTSTAQREAQQEGCARLGLRGCELRRWRTRTPRMVPAVSPRIRCFSRPSR